MLLVVGCVQVLPCADILNFSFLSFSDFISLNFSEIHTTQIRIRVNVVVQRKETPKEKLIEMTEMENKKERTIEEIFQSVKVGTSLTLKEALGKPNAGSRKNLTRLYAGLSSSSNNPLGMSTPGGSERN